MLKLKLILTIKFDQKCSYSQFDCSSSVELRLQELSTMPLPSIQKLAREIYHHTGAMVGSYTSPFSTPWTQRLKQWFDSVSGTRTYDLLVENQLHKTIRPPSERQKKARKNFLSLKKRKYNNKRHYFGQPNY